MLTRRSLLGFIAASPFIVKAASIMPVRSFALEYPYREISLGWLVISGVDQYGRQHSEKLRYVGGGYHKTTTQWQVIDNIAHVDGSFSVDGSFLDVAPSFDRVDGGYDL